MNLVSRLGRHLPDPALLLHALRTALAATLTYVLTHVLGLEQGYWAVFSAVLVMQAHVGGSIQAGWARLLGTAAGAALGALAAAGAEAALGPGTAALTLALAAAIFLCALVAAWDESLRLAGVTAAIVICLHEAGGNAFALGASRFLEVALGVVAALAVSLAWPSRARELARHGAARALEALRGLAAALMESRLSGRYDRQRVFHAKDAALRLALKNRQLLASARREPGPAEEMERLADLLQTLDRLAEHLLGMDHVVEHAPAEGYHQHLPGELSALGAGLGAVLGELSGLAAAGAGPGEALAAALNGLERALAAAEGRLLELRELRAIAAYDLDEVMHFYAFYHALRSAAREAMGLAQRLPGGAAA